MTMSDSSDRVTFQIVEHDPVENLNDPPFLYQMLSMLEVTGTPPDSPLIWSSCLIDMVHKEGQDTR